MVVMEMRITPLQHRRGRERQRQQEYSYINVFLLIFYIVFRDYAEII